MKLWLIVWLFCLLVGCEDTPRATPMFKHGERVHHKSMGPVVVLDSECYGQCKYWARDWKGDVYLFKEYELEHK